MKCDILRSTLGAVLISDDFGYNQIDRSHSLFGRTNLKQLAKNTIVTMGLRHIITCFHVAAYVAGLNPGSKH